VRRTSSIDVSWPQGRAGNAHLVGRARDIITARCGGGPIVLAEDSFEALLKPDRVIVAIDAQPARPTLSRLVGERGGGGLRKAIEAAVPGERQQATPLYLILDDLAGTSLVSGWAWSLWDPDWMANMRAALKDVDLEKAFKSREGVCTGFAPGSSAFDPATERVSTPTPDVRNPEDPDGWHAFTVQKDIGMRRARRIDVWQEETLIIDSAFQDSASTPSGGRAVVHGKYCRSKQSLACSHSWSVHRPPRIFHDSSVHRCHTYGTRCWQSCVALRDVRTSTMRCARSPMFPLWSDIWAESPDRCH
jgi:hypothetical protein